MRESLTALTGDANRVNRSAAKPFVEFFVLRNLIQKGRRRGRCYFARGEMTGSFKRIAFNAICVCKVNFVKANIYRSYIIHVRILSF